MFFWRCVIRLCKKWIFTPYHGCIKYVLDLFRFDWHQSICTVSGRSPIKFLLVGWTLGRVLRRGIFYSTWNLAPRATPKQRKLNFRTLLIKLHTSLIPSDRQEWTVQCFLDSNSGFRTSVQVSECWDSETQLLLELPESLSLVYVNSIIDMKSNRYTTNNSHEKIWSHRRLWTRVIFSRSVTRRVFK